MRYVVLTIFIMTFSLAQAQNKDKSEEEIIKNSVYFGGGSYYIHDDQAFNLKEFLAKYPEIEQYEVIIFSHTDNIGGKEYNEWLSERRGEAVFQKLIEFDVPEEIIKIRDFGQDNPLYDNQSWLGRRANRRVDVILIPIIF